MIETVSDFITPNQANALDLLKADHRLVEDLFERVKENENGNNADVFRKIKQELDVHPHIEETIFYPHLMEEGDKELERIVREGIEEHRQVKAFLSELDGMPGDNESFKAKIKVLMEDVEHHVQEEENEMFPLVEDQVERSILERLGEQMEREKANFKRAVGTERGTRSQATTSG